MSPSSFPSKVNSPAKRRVPLSSTSELRTFLESLFGVVMFGSLFFAWGHRLGRLCCASGYRRRQSGGLVGIDFALADERSPFFDDQLGGADVAEQFPFGFDLNFLFGGDVAADFAPQDDGMKLDVAADDRFVAEVERAFRLNLPVQFSGKSQFARELKVAFDLHIGAEGVPGTGIQRGAHESMILFWSLKPLGF